MDEWLALYRKHENLVRISDNQLKLVKLLTENKTVKLSEYMRLTGLSKSGGYKNIEVLIKHGLIERRGKYKAAYYILTEKGYGYQL